MAPKSVVLVTGSKSGIGKGLLAAYALRPNTVAIAAIRDGPISPEADKLRALPTGDGSQVIVGKYDASSATAGNELVEYLQKQHQVEYLDVVIANAGILNHFGPAKQVKTAELQEHFLINTIAPILLYQATADLLNASAVEPKFSIISSSLGSNALMDQYPMPMIAYGISKAGVNFAAGRIHREEERIVVLPVQPGWVQTEMGERAASFIGVDPKEVPVTIDDSVSGLLKVFDTATKEKWSGILWDQTGTELPW